MIVIMQISKLLFGPLGVILVVLVANGSAGTIVKQVGEQANEVISDTSSSSGATTNNNNVLASANGENQYRANYYYAPAAGSAKLIASTAGNRNVVWNRDSYSDAANDYGYNLESAQAYGVPQQGYQAQYQASSHNTPSFFSNNNNNDGDGEFPFLTSNIISSGFPSTAAYI